MKIGKKIVLDNILKWTGAKNIIPRPDKCRDNTFIDALSTDTRTLEKDDFFVPVKGDNFNGHDFIPEAMKKGCRGIVVEQYYYKIIENDLKIYEEKKPGEILFLKSISNISFLLDLCAGYIRDFPVKTIGITGSAGKTTAKEFMVNIMSNDFRIAYTQKNFNTELGLSKAALEIDEGSQFFIAEIGMRAKGQVKRLSEALNVSTGAITSIGASHLEFFNGVPEIALAKAEIADAIGSNRGTLFLNSDDEWTGFILEHIKGKNVPINIKKFGSNSSDDFSFIEKQPDACGRYRFDFYCGDKKITEIKMPVPGFHNIYNACCAAAVCFHLGASVKSIIKGIEETVPEGGRMRVFNKEGITVIDDSYNASPLSMKEAINTLKLISKNKNARSVALLADMMELGADSEKLHFEIGQYLGSSDVDVLIACGRLSENICRGFEHELIKNKKTAKKKNFYHFNDIKKLSGKISAILKSEDVILIKGSRANKLENIIEYI